MKESYGKESKDRFVTEWVLKTVQEQYPDDIALVVSHTTLRIEEDESDTCFSYFVPATERGERFAQTFILAGVGYDIWGISWERLERFASLEEYNLTCLADGKMLYARTEEDRRRFEALQKKQAEQMADPQMMRRLALQSYERAKTLFADLLFASGGDAKMGVGYVLDYLAQAVAFSNHRYFRYSQTDQIAELTEMPHVPEGFTRLYQEILLEPEEGKQKKGCYELLFLIRQYLAGQGTAAEPKTPPEQNYQDLANWYGELSYTWLRIRYYTQAGDSIRTYMWGILLQNELNQVCGDFGLEKIDLMEAYDSRDLSLIARRAGETEQQIREIITRGGGKIREFATEEAFLEDATRHSL